MPSAEYSPVVSKEDESLGFLQACPRCAHAIPTCRARPKPRKALKIILTLTPWITTILFASLSFYFWARGVSQLRYGSYETGFQTDIISTGEVPLELVRMTGSPRFHENGTAWRPGVNTSAPWPENMQLFGTPTKEIDDNWETYIGHRYFSLSEEEAHRAWGDRKKEYVDQRLGGYSAGLDMFHTLHCVNALRMSLHKDHYPLTNLHGTHHLEHCLDIIRQSIQCFGSTTLIPTKFMHGVQHQYIDSDQFHVCRSFMYLRDWVTSRKKGNERYIERNIDLVDPELHRLAKLDEKSHFLDEAERHGAVYDL